MRTIWKYPIGWTWKQTVLIPRHGRILSVQVQNGTLCLWVDLLTEYAPTKRCFVVIGTGHEITESDLSYLATVQQGEYVWHIFEQLLSSDEPHPERTKHE